MIPLLERGDGPAVTFVHGFGLDGRMWSAQMDAHAARYRTIAIDLPGFGPQGAGANGPQCPAEAVLEVLDACGVERTHLCGHSLGGAVAVDFALAYPARLLSLTLVDALLLGRSPGIASWASCTALSKEGRLDEARAAWMDDALFGPARRRPELALALEEMARDYACGHWTGRVSNRWLAAEPATRLGELRVPSLVIDGELDTPSFRAMAAEYAERLPGARRVSIPDVGHMASMEAPAVFNAALDELLRTPMS